jgi:IMP dehydrogenase
MSFWKENNMEKLITFNDVILLPGWSSIEPKDPDIASRITLNHKLVLPFVSSPMDTVTEEEMAIELARLGGLGVIHRNCTIEEAVNMTRKVKRAESFIISEVFTIRPGESVKSATELMNLHNVHGLPVLNDIENLIGIVTWRDIRFADDRLKVEDVMTKDVITATEEVSLDDAKTLLHKHRIEKLPIVDSITGKLKGLITIKDILLKGKYPSAVRDDEGRLLCAAALSPFDLERAKALDKYADILVIDVAHFHNVNCFKGTKEIMNNVSADVMVGNIGTYDAAVDVLSRLDGVAGLRVGIGSGSICSTSMVTRAGSPTLYATLQVTKATEELGNDIPICADGGIKNSGDIAVALAAGASVCMMGNIFAGCQESPGRLIALEGKYYKQYYGMGSMAARKKRFSFDRYSQPSKEIAEGVEGFVPYRGTINDVINELAGGLKAALGYVGARDLNELKQKAKFGILTPAGMQEMQPHDIITPK